MTNLYPANQALELPNQRQLFKSDIQHSIIDIADEEEKL